MHDESPTPGEPTPEQATEADVQRWLTERRNWGRWGDDDQRGAFNLITAETIVEAARLVRTGVRLSLARPLPTEPSPATRSR